MTEFSRKLVSADELLVIFPQLGSRSSIYKRVQLRRLPVVRESARSAIYFDVSEVKRVLERWKLPSVSAAEVAAFRPGWCREDFGAAPVRGRRRGKGVGR